MAATKTTVNQAMVSMMSWERLSSRYFFAPKRTRWLGGVSVISDAS